MVERGRVTRNIIICSDGTGNTFNDRVTNVTHLIRSLELDHPDQQVAMYDQGVGTSSAGHRAIEAYRSGLQHPEALVPLPAGESTLWPKAKYERVRGVLYGDGFKENVREMYVELAKTYAGPDDRVFLFGFSRGAFTVRALAGLLYRCQLPPIGSADLPARFERAWELYEPIEENEVLTKPFRAKQRPCPVHFLGIWDTVKSYGGIDPVISVTIRS